MAKGNSASEVSSKIEEAKTKGNGYLDLSHFDLEKIPKEIFRTDGWLTQLDLSGTQVSDLSPLQSLTGLTRLYLSGTQVSDLKPIFTLIKKGVPVRIKEDIPFDVISVGNCPLTIPPLEVVEQGNEAIIRYFEERKKQGEENLYEAKIVIIGAGESGKTTLVKKLLNPEHPVPNVEDKRTEGIRITSLSFIGAVAGEPKRLNGACMGLWRSGNLPHHPSIVFDAGYALHSTKR